jgi:hypothetical protein
MIELRETEIDALIRGGLLEHETRNDISAVLKALYAHFSRTLRPDTVMCNRRRIDDDQSLGK